MLMQTAQFQEIFKDFVGVLLTGILGALGVFLIALVKKGFNWLSAKIGLIEDETARQNLYRLNSLLESTVCNVVTSLQQTLADEIKQSIANGDGKYTRDDLLNLKDKAIEQIVGQISEADWEALSEIHTNLIEHVKDLIEVQVYSLKGGTQYLAASPIVSGFSNEE